MIEVFVMWLALGMFPFLLCAIYLQDRDVPSWKMLVLATILMGPYVAITRVLIFGVKYLLDRFMV